MEKKQLNSNDRTPRGYLSSFQAAAYLGICLRTFDTYAPSIPVYRWGDGPGKRAYKRKDLDAFMETRRREPNGVVANEAAQLVQKRSRRAKAYADEHEQFRDMRQDGRHAKQTVLFSFPEDRGKHIQNGNGRR